jgi:hypothetical protein
MGSAVHQLATAYNTYRVFTCALQQTQLATIVGYLGDL